MLAPALSPVKSSAAARSPAMVILKEVWFFICVWVWGLGFRPTCFTPPCGGRLVDGTSAFGCIRVTISQTFKVPQIPTPQRAGQQQHLELRHLLSDSCYSRQSEERRVGKEGKSR